MFWALLWGVLKFLAMCGAWAGSPRDKGHSPGKQEGFISEGPSLVPTPT